MWKVINAPSNQYVAVTALISIQNSGQAQDAWFQNIWKLPRFFEFS